MLASRHGCKLHSAAAVGVEVSSELEGRRKTEPGIELGAEEWEAELGPRAKEDPGSVPGFEHSVNAEPGSMGAGAGAAATIVHNEPSPCGAAIEKAQAKLRQDLAVREERRRELEFLEKGGEPLDFKFGEVPLLTFLSPSPAEPLADQLFSCFGREGEGGSVANATFNGDACEDISSDGVSGRKAVELQGCNFPGNARDVADGIPCKGESPQTNPSISNSVLTQLDLTTKRDSEGYGGACVGLKSQAYTKRNRHGSQHLGNGHVSVKEQEKVAGVNSSLVVAELNEPPVATKDEAMMDMGLQVLPYESQCAVSGKWNGVTTNQETVPAIEVLTRCGTVLEQHPADASNNVGKGRDKTVPPSHVPLKSEDIRANLQVDTGERDPLKLDTKGTTVDLLLSEEKPIPDVQRFHELGEVGTADLWGHVDEISVLRRVSMSPGRARDEGAATGHTGDGTSKQEAEERLGTLPHPSLSTIEKGPDRAHKVVSDGSLSHLPRNSVCGQNLGPKVISGADANILPVTDLMLEGFEGQSTLSSPMISKAIVRGTSIMHVNRDQSAQDDMRSVASNPRIKVEDVAAEDRTEPSATEDESRISQTSGAPKAQELRTEGQAGAVVGGVHRSIGRTSCASALLKSKFPGVVIPWEKEHDPTVQAEAEKHRADISAKAQKAHEDFILEEAAHLQAARNLAVDQALHKPWPEASTRKKAHWDFVLEEMAWMANDFMQESLWKRAAAAQICRCVALQRRRDDFLASELSTRQQKVAKMLANAVNSFWHAVEGLLIKEKAGTSLLEKTQMLADNNSNKNVNEAVPMDVDIPAVEDVVDVGSDKVTKNKSMAIQQYAMRLLKSSGFEFTVQAEAPATPDRHSERSSTLLEPFWEDQFPEVSLFYVVSNGSMEVYRASVESDWAMLEAKHVSEHTSKQHEAEAQAVPDGAEDAAVNSEFGFGDYGNDGGSQDDDFQSQFVPSSLSSGGGLPGIAKKKRKKIPKVSVAGPNSDTVMPLSGFVYQPSVSAGEQEFTSPAVTGKRSLSGHLGSNLPGIIPTKRARSSAANFRPRPAGASTSPGTVGHFPTTTPASQFQPDEEMDALDGSNRGENNGDAPSNSLHTVGSDETFVLSKSKKKKKIKHSLVGSSAPIQAEVRVSASTAIKGSEVDHMRQDPQPIYEVMKRQGDQLLPPGITASETGLGMAVDATETSGFPGLKKSKIVNQYSDGNKEAISGPIQPVSQTGQQSGVLGGSKLTRQNSNRDCNNRRSKYNKGSPLNTPAGMGIPWSSVEDQAILVLVHDLGPNWELVSDVLSYNSQSKGIYRKPKQCRDRHKFLSEQLATEVQENSDDLSSLQQSNAQSPGIPKGNNTRILLQRIHGSVEEDTLKVHLEQIVLTWEKLCPWKPTDTSEQKGLAAPHPSHGVAISQFCTGGPPNPLDLCDRVTANGEVPPHSFTMQLSQHGTGPGVPSGSLPPGSSMQPPSGGMPPGLPGSNGPLGPVIASSCAAINAAAARDAQRFTAMRLSPEETNRLRMATTGSLVAYNRRLQQQAVSVTTGLPVMSGLPHPNDIPLLSTNTAEGMLGGLSRSMSLPRQGLPGLGSAAISNIGSAGLGPMLPPSGVNMGSSVSLPSGSVSGQFIARNARELLQRFRMGACPEEQRIQLIQQLQHQASQGDTQAAAALTSLNSDMVMASSPPPSFSAQQQQQQQQEAQQRNQQQQQLQLQNHQTQQQQRAWQLQAAHVKEQQRQQQLQQHKRPLGALPQPQLHSPNSLHQQMLAPHQPYVPSLGSQHMGPQSQHITSQQSLTLQKQLGQQQQVGGPSQVPQSSLPSSSLQSAPVSPVGSGPSSLTSQQQQPLAQQNQVGGQMPQIPGPSKLVQAKQFQKQQQQNQQQQASRLSKGLSRGPMMMQGLPQSNHLPGSVSIGSKQMPGDLSGQPAAHPLQQGQRVLQPQGQMQSGKLQAWSQQAVTGQVPQLQSQGSQQQGGAQSQVSAAVQQKGHQQQQGTQVVVPKQQQAQPVPTPQQSPPQQQLSLSAPVQQPQLLPPASGQQQQSGQRWPMQQQQEPPPQRLQIRHSVTAIGMPLPAQLGKAVVQQQGQGGSSEMASQPGTPTYQLGTTSSIGTTISSSSPSSHVMPVSSGLKSSTAGVHSSQWMSNQAAPPIAGGMFNLTRTSSPGPAHIPSIVTPSGVHMPSCNGNTGMSIHGASVAGLPQADAIMQNAQGPKFLVGPGPNVRGILGSQQGGTPCQWSQQGSMAMSTAISNTVAQTQSQMQSLSSGMQLGPTTSLVTSGPLNVANHGVPAACQGHSASAPGSGLLYIMQPNQPPHFGNASPTGTVVSQRSATPASSGPDPAAMTALGSTSPCEMPAGAGPPSSA